MKNKSFIAIKAILFTALTVLLMVSCTQDLIPEPTMEKITGGTTAKSDLLPPTNVTATQGGVKNITLTWKETSNANQYKIYAAKTPYDQFVQVAETKDNGTQITISEESGITKYYRVSTVDYQRKESSLSDFVFGSTLATPIITSIDQSEEGTEATIHWWMENCNSDTYLKSVKYEVVVCDTDKKELFRYGIAGQEEIRDLAPVTSYTVTGLQPKTTYFYKVEAHTIQNNDKKEISDMVDAETARRLTPNAPENLVISQGTSSDGITISWTLPEFTDVTSSNGAYERHPVYFTVERKIKGENDKSYEIIAEKISSCSPENLSKKIYHFNCANPSASSAILTVEPSTDEKSETNANYVKYIQGSKISIKDTNVDQGKQYTYRVQSYVDDVKKTISADSCVVTNDGWLISTVEFSAIADYTKNEDETRFTSIKISFDTVFESFGVDNIYTYTINEIYSSFDNSIKNRTTPVYSTQNFANLNSHKIEFTDFTPETEGYYKYSITISSLDGETEYTSMPASGRFTVTADTSKIPVIENFSITDGFADRYELSWKYDSNCHYTIDWQGFDEKGNLLSEKSGSYELTESDVAGFTKDNVETFSLPADSGDRRKFTLTADSGLSDNKSLPEVYETLGTVKPKIINYDYSSITVQWEAVQKADDDYEVSAKYSDLSKHDAELTDPSNTTISNETVDGKKVYTCTITEPFGFDDENLSGLPIKLSIKAKNAAKASETTAIPVVKTVGPAAINSKITTEKIDLSSQIAVQWDKVDGAAGYIIQRVIYSDASAAKTKLYKADKYFFNASTAEITVSTGETDSSRVTVTENETGTRFTLTDTYKEPSSADGYQDNQSRIKWGLPFGYVVIPVKEGGTITDFEFSDTELFKLTEASKVCYNKNVNLSDKIGSTYGYGLNVTAAKSENSSTINVKWSKPYNTTKTVPVIYRRQNGSSEWEIIKSLDSGTTSYNDDLTDSSKYSAYYYAVQYSTNDKTPLNYINSYKNHQDTIDNRYNDGITSETLNKGYLFYVDLTAGYNGDDDDSGHAAKNENYYSEKVSHRLWDFSERARGPSSYVIKAKNLNTTYDYIKLADININTTKGDEHFGEETITLNAVNNVLQGDGGDTSITLNGSNLILKPIGISNGSKSETDGIMKILRSSKTYYQLDTSRSFEVNGSSGTASHQPEVWAYRQITDTELAKCVGLIIADSLYKAGAPYKYSSDFIAQPKDDASTDSTGAPGKMTFTHTSWADYFQWSFNGSDYKNKFEKGCSSIYQNEYISDFALNGGTSEKIKGCSSNTVYYFPPLDFTIIHDSGLESYKCKINFTCGTSGTKAKWNLAMLKDGNPLVTVTENQTEFLKYFPYDIGTKHENGDTTVNTNLQTYKNAWWN